MILRYVAATVFMALAPIGYVDTFSWNSLKDNFNEGFKNIMSDERKKEMRDNWKEMRDNLNAGVKNVFDEFQRDGELRDKVKLLLSKAHGDEARSRLSWKFVESAFLLYGGAEGGAGAGTKAEADFRREDNSEKGKACRILGLVNCSDLSAEELRRNCRRLSSEWHPDKYAETAKENAKKRFFQIQDACETLKLEP